MTRTRAWLAAVLAIVVVVLGMGMAQSQAQTHHTSTNAKASAAVHSKAVGQTFCQASTTCTRYLEFNSAFDTHVYNVFMGAGATKLTVDSEDCCIQNDHWGVVVNKFGGVALGSSNPVAAACGNGSISAFSGPASLTGAYGNKVIQVVVTHCSGVSTFPAGLYVRFTADQPIQQVTQKSGLGVG